MGTKTKERPFPYDQLLQLFRDTEASRADLVYVNGRLRKYVKQLEADLRDAHEERIKWKEVVLSLIEKAKIKDEQMMSEEAERCST